jgi:hypothetical protein
LTELDRSNLIESALEWISPIERRRHGERWMDLFEVKEQLRENGILISFSGSFSHSIIEELGTAVKKYLESSESKKPAMMDVFSVYIEAAQNVRNYSERQLAAGATKADLDANIVVIARHDEHYQIYAGNAVATGDVPVLTARLERLAGMDKTELKALYKEQLRKERGPDDGGAGLGLIEMARRASEPLRYTFTPIDNGTTYFSLCVTI